MSDLTEPQATSRLTGTLSTTFGAYASYLIQVGTEGATSIYTRLARAITQGIIPYIDTHDKILSDRIDVEQARNDSDANRLQSLERRVSALEGQFSSVSSRIQTLGSQVSSAQALAQQSAQLARTSIQQSTQTRNQLVAETDPVLVQQRLQEQLRVLVGP